VQECASAFGSVDFAHNNAGIELTATVEETAVEDWDKVLAVNLKGVWLELKQQMAHMRTNGGGSIINTASLAGGMAFRSVGAYMASKFGVIGITRAAALEGADAGIRVNAIVPTAVRTPMIERFAPEVQDHLIAPHAIKRMSEPNEVAEAVVWL